MEDAMRCGIGQDLMDERDVDLMDEWTLNTFIDLTS